MNEVCPSCRNRLGWLRCLLVALPSTWLSISALAACGDAETAKTMRSHVVYLELCTPRCISGADANASATGVLVAKNGLVLSVYELVKEVTDLTDDTKYEVVASKGKQRGDPAKGAGSERYGASVVGFDKQRGLLLLQINNASVGSLGLAVPRIEQEALNEGVELCSIGYTKVYESAVLPKGRGEARSLSPHRRYQFDTDFTFDELQRGSPVYLAKSPETPLVGIASADKSPGQGMWSEVIPIEYADVLIARVFIANLKAQLGSMSDHMSDQMKSLTSTEQELRKLTDKVRLLEVKTPAGGPDATRSNECKWSIPEKSKNCRLAVACEKLSAEPPYIEVGDFRVEVDYTDKTGVSGKKTEPWQSTVRSEEVETAGAAAANAPPQIKSLKNTFCLGTALDHFDAQKSKYGWRSIQNILISVKPFAQYDDQPGTDLELITLKSTPYPGSGN